LALLSSFLLIRKRKDEIGWMIEAKQARSCHSGNKMIDEGLNPKSCPPS